MSKQLFQSMRPVAVDRSLQGHVWFRVLQSYPFICRNYSKSYDLLIRVPVVKTSLKLDSQFKGHQSSVANIQEHDYKISQKLKQSVIDIRIITNEDTKKQGISKIPFGFIGPDLSDNLLSEAKLWEKKFIRIADNSVENLESFICGNNIKDEHKIFYNWNLLNTEQLICDIRKAKPGDRCVHDKTQKLQESKGIEIGHIFQLGTKYSESLNATFTNKKGIEDHFWMGCYGIGISRLAQAAV